jgi:hypothetical protein
MRVVGVKEFRLFIWFCEIKIFENMKEKVILNTDFTDVLLSMAFQEGLLVADRLKTDAVYEKYKNHPFDFNLSKSLLEQLILSPIPIIRTKFLDGVEGRLLEENEIDFEDKELKRLVPLNNYPTELFLAILRGNGLEISKEKFEEEIKDIIEINNELEKLELEFDGELPNLGMERLWKEVFEKSGLWSNYI